MKDRLPSKYAAATRRIDIVCGKYSADAWGSSVAMTAHGASCPFRLVLANVPSPNPQQPFAAGDNLLGQGC